jgi:integrase
MVNRRRFHQVVGLESEGFTKTQAEDLIASLRAQKHTRKHGIPSSKASAATFADAAKSYLTFLRETGGKDVAKKDERLRLHLLPKLGGLQLASMTAADLKRYSAKRVGEGASPGTINRELAVVSHLFRVASDPEGLGLIAAVPCRIGRLREPDAKTVYLTASQAQALLKAARADANRQLHTFAMIGLHTGMRYSSILALKAGDVDLDRRVIWIGKDKAGERQQPITQELADFLKDRLGEDPKAWLFPASRSKTGHAVNVRKAWHRAVKKAGLEHVGGPHVLRHTMASSAAHAGVDGATLQALGGWKTRRMVERYTHAGALREAMNKLAAAYKPKRKVTHKLSTKKRETA